MLKKFSFLLSNFAGKMNCFIEIIVMTVYGFYTFGTTWMTVTNATDLLHIVFFDSFSKNREKKLSFCCLDTKKSYFENKKNKIAVSSRRIASIKCPIHHAPTHFVLLMSKPIDVVLTHPKSTQKLVEKDPNKNPKVGPKREKDDTKPAKMAYEVRTIKKKKKKQN